MVTIQTYLNSAEAGLAKSLLESRGLHPFLHGENSFNMEPLVALGIRLQMPDGEAEEARRILEDGEGVTPLPDDFIPPDEP